MRLVTYRENGKEKWGFILKGPEGEYVCSPQDVEDNLHQIRKGGSCFALEQTSFLREGRWPADLAGFLAMEEEGMEILRRMHAFLQRYAFEQDVWWCSRYVRPLGEVSLTAPIPRPRIYWGLVSNCPSFCRLDPERKNFNLVPQGHNRPQAAACGQGDTIVLEESSFNGEDPFNIGFNVELGIVIGKKGRDIRAEDAMGYVAGYTNVMDLAPVDYFLEYDPPGTPPEKVRIGADFFLNATASWGGKKMDCMGPMGPYLVTRDEIVNPYDLICHTRQNGMKRDRCWTGALMVGIERTIAYYSSFATLYPGDVLHMATMGIDGLGLNSSFEPGPEDTLEVETEKLGCLKMHVVRPGKRDWREPADPSLGRYRAPSVRAAEESGRGETDRFLPGDTRSFFICFGNYRTCQEREGLIPLLDIPRFLNNPVSALSTEHRLVTARRMTSADIGIELAVVIKKIAAKIREEDAEEYILGYSPMVVVSDHSLYEELNKPATGQESGLTGSVYSRWGDGYNMLLPDVVYVPEKTLYSRDMELEITGAGRIRVSTAAYLVTAARTIAAISRHITLMPDDVISLGNAGAVLHVDPGQMESGIHGTACIEGIGAFDFSCRNDRTAE